MKKKVLIGMMVLATAALTGCSAEKEADKAKTEAETEKEADKAKTEAATEKETGKGKTEAAAENAAENTGEAESGDKQDLSGKSAAGGLFGTFETVTSYGTPVTQDIFTEAELTMVNIWGTFCSPCIREMPDLGELADEYAEKGVQIVGIISDVTTAWNTDVELIIQETGADYTHLVVSQSLWNSYLSGVQVVPTTVFVDSEGNQVGEVYTGSKEKEVWAAIIDEALGLLE